MPGLSSVLDGWFGILYLIKDAAVLFAKTKMALLNLCPDLLPPTHLQSSTELSQQGSDFLRTRRLEDLPCFTTSQNCTETRTHDTFHLYLPRIIYWGHFCQAGGLFQRGFTCMYSTLVPFFFFFFSCALYSCVMGVLRWFPMDPMWWMLLMKGVNLKSPAGYSRSIQEAASSPIQCSLRTDRGRPREKWGDGIGFEALRQVIKSNTPTHQGMWFPQVPLADMLNFLL